MESRSKVQKDNNSKQESQKIMDILSTVDIPSDAKMKLLTASREELFYWITSQPSDQITVDKACSFITLLLPQSDETNLEYGVLKVISQWLKTNLESKTSTGGVLSTLNVLLVTQPNVIPHIIESFFYSSSSVLLNHMDYLVQQSRYNGKFMNELNSLVEIFDRLMSNILPSKTNLCSLKLSKFESIADFILRLHFINHSQILKTSNSFQLSISSLSVLSKVVTICTEFAKTRIGELLGIIKAYMYIGLGDLNESLTSFNATKLQISHQSIYDLPEEDVDGAKQSAGGKISKTRKLRSAAKNTKALEQNYMLCPQYFDFEVAIDVRVSESESENESNRNMKNLSKIRLAALSLLSHLVRVVNKHLLYGYWYAFFPNSEASSEGILYVATHDSNTRCRIAALQLSSHLIQGAKGFLEQAETSDKEPSSFLPFSIYLGQTVLTMYGALSQAVDREPSTSVLIQVIKCIAVLVQSTPFQRISGQFVLKLVHQMQNLVHHKDVSIQVSALTVMEFLISTPKLSREVSEAVGIPVSQRNNNDLNPNRINDSDDACEVSCFEEYVESDDEGNITLHERPNNSQQSKKTAPDDVSWLLNIVLENLVVPKKSDIKISAAVRIESLQVLNAMASHFLMLLCKLDEVADVLQQSLQDSLPDVRLYAARCLDCVGYKMNEYLVGAGVRFPNEELLICQRFWSCLLPVVISKISDREQTNAIKVHLCDFLSNIGVHIFMLLPHASQTSLLSFLSCVGSDVDENAIVRAAAIRALAVFSLFPSLRENLVFVENTAELTIPLVSDTNLLVRIKALWSIGNISDALITNSGSAYTEHISNNLLVRLVKVATDACSDNDKVRCNAVRALGNLLRLLTNEMLDDANYRHLFQLAVEKLVDCIKSSGNAKVKWNSCYAVGCLMKNNALFAASSTYPDFTWRELIFPSLCHLIIQHSNFKVRINAASAITNVQKRSFFGEFFVMCWCSLLTALEKSYDLTNFLEYNHRDCLQERICIAMSHITRLALDVEFVILKNKLVDKIEIVKETWFRVVNRMSPESAAPLLSCPVQLKERIILNEELSMEDRNAILFISNTFLLLK